MCIDTVLSCQNTALVMGRSIGSGSGWGVRHQDVTRADFVQVSIGGLKVPTLRAGLRRALQWVEGVKLAQRGEETFLVRKGTGIARPDRPRRERLATTEAELGSCGSYQALPALLSILQIVRQERSYLGPPFPGRRQSRGWRATLRRLPGLPTKPESLETPRSPCDSERLWSSPSRPMQPPPWWQSQQDCDARAPQ